MARKKKDNRGKYAVYGVIAVAVITALFFSLPARAQFRPCVWPNTCTN